MPKDNIKELRDGTKVVLRLLKPEDTDALYKFFTSLSLKSREFLYDNVADRKVVEAWTKNINYNHVLPLVATVGDEIVADATLHKRDTGPSRHMARLRVAVLDSYKHKGLGTILTNELTNIAKARKLKQMAVTLAEKSEISAISTLERLGFKKSAVIPEYLIDLEGNVENAVVMIKKL